MGTMTDFFAMGGYAAYVWPAYAVTLLVLVAMMVASVRSLRQRRKVLAVLDAARSPRPTRQAPPGP
jgi:heme exporter protein D